MGIFQQFPYTNFHEMNLDQLIKIMKQMQDEWAETKQEWANVEEYINNYFANLDVSEEVLEALQALAASGELNQLIDPVIITETANWLAEHITPTTPAVDDTLTVSGAAADAEVTGTRLKNAEAGNTVDFVDDINYLYMPRVDGKYIRYYDGQIGTNPTWSYYWPIKIDGGFYYNAEVGGAHIAFYDANMNYLSGLQSNNNPMISFKAPDNAQYMAYSCVTASIVNPYVEKATFTKVEYVDPEWKKLNHHVGLQLNHFTPVLTFGKNLFNKWNLINGVSIHYVNGDELWTNASYCYCPDYMPAKPSTDYVINVLGSIIGEYDADYKCVACHNLTSPGSVLTFTSTADTRYIRVGARIDTVNTLQVEEGITSTSYEQFGYRLSHSIASSDKFIISVNGDGSGDYTTIAAAVTAANNNDIILVYPGTYTESVKAQTKKVHIIGLDRDKCILTYGGLDYQNPPLQMAKGSVQNLTITATNSGTQGDHNAYCVHIDYNDEANEALFFENVKFVNEVHQAVGIGLRPHFELVFNNCIFDAQDQAALYCHDWETADTSQDLSMQHLTVTNCTLKNNSNSHTTILLQSQELADKCSKAVFQRNIVLNKGTAQLISMYLYQGRTLTNTNFLGSSDWELSDDSALNTLATINKF